ncbi:hypothetical protein [Actinokineospora sp. NBRC 105648]|uniref:hypothetical protein n=1 Tax=Actinokineospora sp. NBRC 105648 TaxID=3032206 RepID=UPI0024A00927|nr:hypothetical protein [Actinokineospora sp. NBRC 105648]GLZ39014.1 hypothetical protein Acsp05_26380 [Actinokineospora sp. NBRC 105648]
MAAKSLKFVLIANWIFACFLSFTTLVYWDEDTPLPVQAGIIVGAWDESRPAGELRAEIKQFAIEHQITVGRLKDDLNGSQGGRTIYLVDGDPAVGADEWLRGGYADFTRSLTTSVRPFDDAGERDPTGSYVVFGDYDKAGQLADFFTSKGMRVNRVLDRWSLNPKDLFLQDAQVLALGMMVLVSVAVAAASVLVGARAYGVNRLQGLGYGSLLLNDVRAVSGFWFGGGVLTIGVAVAALAAYNGLADIGLYLLTAVVLHVLLTGAAITSHALVLLLLMRLRVLAAVKGELPGRTASGVAYALRVVTVVATVALAQQAVATGIDVERRGAALASYERLGETSKIAFGNVWSSGDREKIIPVTGAWLRGEDQRGNALLAGRQYLGNPGPLNGKDLIYVNDRFLRDQPVRLSTGADFSAGDAGGPTVLIPPDVWDHRAELVTEVLHSPNLRRGTAVTFDQVEMAAGAEIFTYTATDVGPVSQGNFSGDQSFTTDPILVFLPSAQGLLSDHSYTAFASQGRVLFPDPRVVSAAVAADPALVDFVVSVTPVIDQAATEHRDVLQQFRLALFSALAGLLVLLITGVGAVLIHARRNAQWIFARHVSGWRFAAVHRILLIFEAAALAVLIGWLPYQAWSVNSDLEWYRRAGMPAPFEPMTLGTPEWAAIGGLATLTVGGILAALIRAHRRVVRDGASEA